MINTDDYILILRNGHIDSLAIAAIPNAQQNTIGLKVYNGQNVVCDRKTGIVYKEGGGDYLAKIVTKTIWDKFDESMNEGRANKRILQEQREAEEQLRTKEMIDKANAWYDALSKDDKHMVDILLANVSYVAVG